MSRLPTFFIVGAPKAATTSLYHYLDQHPQIYMSAIKEPHFFAPEIRVENLSDTLRLWNARQNDNLREFLSGPMLEKRFSGIVTNREDYERLFANAGSQPALGEASACYLWSPGAPILIGESCLGAQIIVMLRDPAERAYSQYLHGVATGAIRWSFRDHIHRNLRHRSEQICIHYPFLEFGLYSRQLDRYLKRFGRQVWVGIFEDFRIRTFEVYQTICRFLNVAPDFVPDFSQHHMAARVPRLRAINWLKRGPLWETASRLTPRRLWRPLRKMLIHKPGAVRMHPADRRYLIDFYREDIRNLETLLDRSVEHWLR